MHDSLRYHARRVAQRRFHYEQAFEHYLRANRVPYVAVDEAKKALAEVQARLAKTHEEIRGMLDEARRDAQVVKDQLRAEASADAQAERERMRREIETARDQALQDIYQQSVMLAALVSTKAIKRELTPSDHSRLLDEALADLKTNMGTKT